MLLRPRRGRQQQQRHRYDDGPCRSMATWVVATALLVVQMLLICHIPTSNSFTVLPTTTTTTTTNIATKSFSSSMTTSISKFPFLLFASVEDETTTEATTTSAAAAVDEEDEEETIKNEEAEATKKILQDVMKEYYPTGTLLELMIPQHRPLGCTVEESLAQQVASSTNGDANGGGGDAAVSNNNRMPPPVFVSRVTSDGNAEKAGLQLGDVIVGVTGLFGNVMPVNGYEIERVRDLVGAVPEDQPLKLCVARGTTVLEEHESALVDLCSINTWGVNEKQIEDCLVNFLSTAELDGEDEEEDGIEMQCDNDEDLECMMDAMTNMWADELPPSKSSVEGISDNPEPASTKKVKPWSARSSPSGTWVRDPKTGEMRNIDA